MVLENMYSTNMYNDSCCLCCDCQLRLYRRLADYPCNAVLWLNGAYFHYSFSGILWKLRTLSRLWSLNVPLTCVRILYVSTSWFTRTHHSILLAHGSLDNIAILVILCVLYSMYQKMIPFTFRKQHKYYILFNKIDYSWIKCIPTSFVNLHPEKACYWIR